MRFLCRQMHITEEKCGDAKLEIFCKGCNKFIKKVSTYKFLRSGHGWYLAQESKPVGRKKVQIRKREYFRKYCSTPKYKEWKREYNRQYNLRKKALKEAEAN